MKEEGQSRRIRAGILEVNKELAKMGIKVKEQYAVLAFMICEHR